MLERFKTLLEKTGAIVEYEETPKVIEDQIESVSREYDLDEEIFDVLFRSSTKSL
jgi:hypothetical protein